MSGRKPSIRVPNLGSLVCCLAVLVSPSAVLAQDAIVHAARVLDGRGALLENVSIRIRDGRIADVRPRPGSPEDATYDLGDLTVLPGLIDTHVHIGWHFDSNGKTHSRAVEETLAQTALYGVENAYVTLMGGVTTVQSLGSATDADLRDWIARGTIPGPRILTSLRSVNARTGSAAEIRAFVTAQADAGADVVKVFASASIRDGGAPTLTLEQLHAACGQAAIHGLRSVVHAHGPESARRSIEAGCTTIEHGSLLDRATLELMAERGTYFDPNVDLIFRNYFENKERFLGIGNYTDEGFAQMERAAPSVLEVFKQALTIPDLNLVFGTDAVAGAHGRKRAGTGLSRHRGRSRCDGGDRLGNVACRRVARARGRDRRDCARHPSRLDRGGGRPAHRHHRARARAFRDEAWGGVLRAVT